MKKLRVGFICFVRQFFCRRKGGLRLATDRWPDRQGPRLCDHVKPIHERLNTAISRESALPELIVIENIKIPIIRERLRRPDGAGCGNCFARCTKSGR
jgi:hypothetical protein